MKPTCAMPLLTPRLLAGEPGEDAEHPEHQVQDVVGGVDGDDGQDLVAAADDEPPDREYDVEEAEAEGERAGSVAGGEQADRAGHDVEDVAPAVDGEDPEHLDAGVVAEGVAAGSEVAVVEEADDA